jgi:hypothetical protein
MEFLAQTLLPKYGTYGAHIKHLELFPALERLIPVEIKLQWWSVIILDHIPSLTSFIGVDARAEVFVHLTD